MISIRLADEVIKIKQCFLAELLQQKGYGTQGYAVAVNRQFVAAAAYQTTLLQHNDAIEIIVPMQGG